MAGERLILTGFMGMGKSTVGPMAAAELGVAFYDTDEWMEQEAKIDIPGLLSSDPEAFRRMEVEALNDILGCEPGIVATGGGIVSTEIGRQALKATDVLKVWLNGSFDLAARRVARDATGRVRPLFQDLAKAYDLFEERQPWYEETMDFMLDPAPSEDVVAQGIVRVAHWWYQTGPEQ